MKMFSWNVNGLRAVLNSGALTKFITEVEPDVFCMQEVKIDAGTLEKLDLGAAFLDYEKYYCLAARKGYSGTAIWVKKGAGEARPLPCMTAAFGEVAEEGRITGVEMADFYVLSVYVPNSKRDLSRLELRQNSWGPELQKLVFGLQKTKPVVICGDFNVAHEEIDLSNPKANRGMHGFTDEERQDFSELLEKDGLIDTFRIFNKEGGNYTWWAPFANARARNIGWRIDYFLASKSLRPRIKSAEIYPEIMGSDHCPVGLEVR